MTTLTVVTFPTSTSAGSHVRQLEGRQARSFGVVDAAVVSWVAGEAKPEAWQVRLTAGAGRELDGAFWGMLFSHVFLIPMSRWDIPLDPMESDQPLAHLGLGPERLTRIRNRVVPGTSAILLVHNDDQTTQLAAAAKRSDGVAETFPLSPDETRRVYAGFGASNPDDLTR